VLITDQRMPGMTGVELAEHARRHHPDVVRLLVTAFSDHNVAVEAINRGHIRGYLRKPWDGDELIAILREAEGSYALRRRARQLELHMIATEKVYTLGVVTAGVAHELRNPLAMLAHDSNFLREELRKLGELVDDGETDRARATIDALQPVIDNLQQAVDGMASVCRGLDLGARVVDENAICVIREAVELATRMALPSIRDRAQLTVELHSNQSVRGRCSDLARVVLNLLVNAYESIADDREDGAISVRLYDGDDERVIIEVADNGSGMSAATQRRVFEPFFSTRESGGTGIGLPISRSIVEDCGGELTFESEEGAGTTFRLLLRKATPA
jgi:signal transduction histidine kinase